MCGGRGTRLDAPVEKPLFAVGGEPMVDRVARALSASRVDAVHAVVSPHVPATRDHLDLPTIETPGEGYVADLEAALVAVERPVLTVAADLPLLDGDVIDRVLDGFAGQSDGSLAVCVPAALKRRLGIGVDTSWRLDGRSVAPAGLNVVGDGADRPYLSYDARLAVTVNRLEDASVAEALL